MEKHLLARPLVRFPAGLRCVFSSVLAVSSSIFVGAEREENLIRKVPDKSEFTMKHFFARYPLIYYQVNLPQYAHFA